ncbi:hypothetical protein EXS70_01435 [Candidatus Peribacteria bacterium]|nr:hypothetical protein [Candidatus Peribacteria bacterium]
MSISGSIHDQLRALDHQLVELLAERVTLCRRAMEEGEHAFDAAAQAELLSEWQEMGDEKGLHLGAMTIIGKGLMKLCKSEE